MSAEDYDDVPGFGGGLGFNSTHQRQHMCNFCRQPINFSNRKPFNKDGSPHRCKSSATANKEQPPQYDKPQAAVFALAAMNAIINAQIQVGGIDHIHVMNFYDIADVSWRVAAAMVSKEKAFSEEYRFGSES